MISSRFGILVSVLLAVALAPTILHRYIGIELSDGRVTKAISKTLVGLESIPTKRTTDWVKDMFAANDWIERRYSPSTDENVRLFVARSYDQKRLYHHPELALVYAVDLQDRGTMRLPNMPDIPIHVLIGASGSGLAVYTLLYDGRFVDNPIAFQLKLAWQSLFSARKPMTLFFAYDEQSSLEAPLETLPPVQLLHAAMDSFQLQTP